MERSQSYTSFETTASGSIHSSYNNLSRTNINNINTNSNNNNNNNNYKNKFASTSSLNLRKALELRQTQLQRQQQEQLQRQQWQMLYEQRQKQLQQQLQQQLQHSASSDNLLNSPLYLSSLNGLQLLQKRHQKLLQRQKSTSVDELDFPHTPAHTNMHDDNNNNVADDDDDVDVDEVEGYAVNLRQNDENQQHHIDDDIELTSTAAECQLNSPLQQKFYQFQRQRPFSEASISYRATSPLANLNLNHQNQIQNQNLLHSPTSSNTTTTSTMASSISITERRRLQQYDQSISFDSAISNTNSSASTTNTPSIANIINENMSPLSRRHPNFGKLKRDNSLHSDSSRYSSVDSLLESRKPDPEAILINLGFGPVFSEDILSRIPKRFLKPSQVRGIDTDAFVRRLQLASSLADHSVLGYRGLIGNPDLPPSTIVAKIMQRFEVNERKKSMGSIEHTIR